MVNKLFVSIFFILSIIVSTTIAYDPCPIDSEVITTDLSLDPEAICDVSTSGISIMGGVTIDGNGATFIGPEFGTTITLVEGETAIVIKNLVITSADAGIYSNGVNELVVDNVTFKDMALSTNAGISISSGYDLTFEDITIEGAIETPIGIQNSDTIVFRNVNITQDGVFAIYMNSNQNVQFYNIDIITTGYDVTHAGIYLFDTNTVQMNDINIEYGRGSGIFMEQEDNYNIYNYHALNTGSPSDGWGLRINDGVARVNVINMTSDTETYLGNIRLEGVSEVYFENLNVTGADEGIYISSALSPTSDITFKNVRVVDSDTKGLLLYDVSNIVFDNLYLSDISDDGDCGQNFEVIGTTNLTIINSEITELFNNDVSNTINIENTIVGQPFCDMTGVSLVDVVPAYLNVYEFKDYPDTDMYTLLTAPDLSAVGFNMGNQYGTLFWAEDMDLTTYTDLDSYVEIGHNSIYVDSVTAPNLANKIADVKLMDTGYTSVNQFVIKKDGVLYDPSLIEPNGYVPNLVGDDDWQFYVESFSNYTLEDAVSNYTIETNITTINETVDLDGTSMVVTVDNVVIDLGGSLVTDGNLVIEGDNVIVQNVVVSEAIIVTGTNVVFDNVIREGITSTEFVGDTTEFIFVPDLTNVSLVLATSTGEIVWSSPIDLTINGDLDLVVDISSRRIVVNSDVAANLDQPATLTFYGTGFTNLNQFLVYKDGVVCSDCVVTLVGGNVQVEVTGFSEYTLEQQETLGLREAGQSCRNTQNTIFAAFALISIFCIVGAAFLIINLFGSGGGFDTGIVLVISIVGLAIVLFVGYIIIATVGTTICSI